MSYRIFHCGGQERSEIVDSREEKDSFKEFFVTGFQTAEPRRRQDHATDLGSHGMTAKNDAAEKESKNIKRKWKN